MRNVYFIQANLSYGKAHYLPYATGCLAAYSWSFECIRNNYNIGAFIYTRDPIETTLKRIVNPDVVAFSCYNWTFEYNKILAKNIKKLYPDCLIIFGGHNVSPNFDILSELDYVDVLIYGEGEYPFRDILEARLSGSDFSNINNISFRSDRKIISTPRLFYKTVDDFPSPYVIGLFDDIVTANPEKEFCAVVETNRGCPYNCAYCDWCYSTDLRPFPIERVKKDILWCSENRIEYIFCADGNFGILKRDLDIAKYVVTVRNKNGYPHIFNTCFAKNSNDIVFEISKMFYDNKLNKAATLAYQSVNPVVLKNINRTNFNMESFSTLIKRYNENKIPTYTEMILGLPGETYDSFCDGLCLLMKNGQQSALTVYYCQVYCNSLLSTKEYIDKFGIKTADVPMNYLHSSVPEYDDITEFTRLVIGTDSLPFNDMVRCIIFCTCLQCFHYIGLLKYFAIYVNQELNVDYRTFYDSLLDFIFSSKGTFINSVFEKIKAECSDFTNGEWSYSNEKFGDIGWFLEEGLYMEYISNFDVFWKEIEPFLRSFSIDESVFEQLLIFQKFAVRLPGQKHIEKTFDYDFIRYFDDIITGYRPLKKIKNKVRVTITNPVYNWKDYARKVMLFAKRRGDTITVNDRKNVKIEYEGM